MKATLGDSGRLRGLGLSSVSLVRPLTNYLRTGVRYRFEEVSVYNLESDVGPFLRQQEGTRTTSSVALSLTRNTIDDILNPSKGVIAEASVELAGGPFMGDNQFVKAIASYGQYFPYKWGTTFFLRGIAGTVRPYGGKGVPIYERFFIGGISTMRGFKYGEAGPRDPATDDVIGGLNELIFNLEWIFPIYKPAGVKGVVFVDVGHGFDNTSGFYGNGIRVAGGFGIRWFSPMGPIRLEMGFNLNPRAGERTSVFDFAMGRSF